jgi:hypothetical protein
MNLRDLRTLCRSLVNLAVTKVRPSVAGRSTPNQNLSEYSAMRRIRWRNHSCLKAM